jgi:uncharacterized membrane protein (UPF0127 family)
MQMSICQIINLTRGTTIAEHAEWARSFGKRLRGLMFRDALPDGSGLVLEPNNSVHTFGMRFAIDVIFVDAHGCVVGMAHAMPPNRPFAGAWRARRTLEVPVGVIDASRTQLGDVLQFMDRQ